MQGRPANLVRRRVTVDGVTVDLVFDPKAFALLSISSENIAAFNAAADDFCQFATTQLRGNDRSAKAYYIHKAYADAKDYHFVCSNLYAANPTCTSERVEDYASKRKTYTITNTNTVNYDDVHTAAAKEFVSALEKQVKEDFLNGRTTAKPTPTTDELKQSQERKIQDDLAALLGFRDVRQTVKKQIDHSKSIVENSLMLIQQTKREIVAKFTSYISAVDSTKKPEQVEFYAIQTQYPKDLEQKVEELNLEKAALDTKELELEAIFVGKSQQTAVLIREALDTKISILKALHTSASEFYANQILTATATKKEALRNKFNANFAGIAEIDSFGCLTYYSDCLGMTLESFVKHVNNTIKTHSDDKESYNTILFNLQIELSISGKKVELKKHRIGAPTLEIKPGFNVELDKTVKADKATINTTAQQLMQGTQEKNDIAASCATAKKQSQEVLDSLATYSEFKHYQNIKTNLASALAKHLSDLKVSKNSLTHIISSNNDSTAQNIAAWGSIIDNEIGEIEEVQLAIADKEGEFAIEYPISYHNITKNRDNAYSIVHEYNNKLRLSTTPDAVLQAAEKKFAADKMKYAQDSLLVHPKYHEYTQLLKTGAALKKELVEAADKTKLEKLEAIVNQVGEFSTKLAPVGAEERANLYDPEYMATTIARNYTNAQENLAAVHNDFKLAKSTASLIPSEIPAHITSETIEKATAELQESVSKLSNTLANAKENSAKITANLQKQRQDYYPLITKNYNLMKFCDALVNLILDNEFWATQVTAGGTRSPYLDKQNRAVNVPDGIARMQSRIKWHFDKQKNPRNFLDGDEPLAAVKLLKSLQACAATTSRGCGMGFFKNLIFRNATTSNLYQYLNHLNIDTIFNDRNVTEGIKNSPRLVERDTTNSLNAFNDSYIDATITAMKNSIGYTEPRLQPIANNNI